MNQRSLLWTYCKYGIIACYHLLSGLLIYSVCLCISITLTLWFAACMCVRFWLVSSMIWLSFAVKSAVSSGNRLKLAHSMAWALIAFRFFLFRVAAALVRFEIGWMCESFDYTMHKCVNVKVILINVYCAAHYYVSAEISSPTQTILNTFV